MKKISAPPLLKMRTLVSEDGRWARFFLLFTTGQNAAFNRKRLDPPRQFVALDHSGLAVLTGR
jgi:hypothetical protein